MHRKHVLAAAIAMACVASASQAFAGASAVGNPIATLDILGDDGYGWSLQLGSALSFDAATGGVTLKTDSATVAGLDSTVGGWNVSTVSIIDPSSPVGQQTTKTVAALKWNSWLHADGTTDHVSSATNPWASTFTLAVQGDVDPFLTYGFTAKNSSSINQTYTFALGEAIVPPVNGAYSIYADVAGSLSDGLHDGVALTPVGSKVQILNLSPDGGSSFVNAGVDVGPAVSNLGTTTYGSFSNSTTGSGSYDFWEVTTKFKLTPNNDVASLSGFAQITPAEVTPVPEPQAYAMLLAGLCMLSAVALRRAN